MREDEQRYSRWNGEQAWDRYLPLKVNPGPFLVLQWCFFRQDTTIKSCVDHFCLSSGGPAFGFVENTRRYRWNAPSIEREHIINTVLLLLLLSVRPHHPKALHNVMLILAVVFYNVIMLRNSSNKKAGLCQNITCVLHFDYGALMLILGHEKREGEVGPGMNHQSIPIQKIRMAINVSCRNKQCPGRTGRVCVWKFWCLTVVTGQRRDGSRVGPGECRADGVPSPSHT